MTQVTLRESGYKVEITEEMLKEMSQHGDTPSDWGYEVDDDRIYWVGHSYALNDREWDIAKGYPEHLPLWAER